MEELKRALIEKAEKKFKKIKPCLTHADFSNSFTVDEGRIIFWFNTEEDTTRILTSKINN
jgi:hypothetical protein